MRLGMIFSKFIDIVFVRIAQPKIYMTSLLTLSRLLIHRLRKSYFAAPAAKRDWDEWEPDPTNGVETRTCQRCAKTDARNLLTTPTPTPLPTPSPTPSPSPTPHVHTPITVNKKDTSCTETGYTGDVVCETCHEVITEGTVIPVKEHTPVDDPAVPASCTDPGKTAGSHCSVCNTVITAQTTVPAKGHSGGTATCLKKAVCSTCGQEYGELGDHHYVEVEPALEPSCEYPGMTAFYRCDICDEAEIPSEPYGEPLGHLPASVWSHDAEYHWHACTRADCEAQLDLGGPYLCK